MNKKNFILILLLISIGLLSGCKPKQLSAPSNFKIENGIASWDAVEGATKYRLEFFGEGSYKRVTSETSVDLNSFSLPVGSYEVKIVAVGDEEKYLSSDYSQTVLMYFQKDADAVSILEENSLMDTNYVKWNGRTQYNKIKKMNMIFHSASGFEVKFNGTRLEAKIYATNYSNDKLRPYIVYVIDDNFDDMKRIPLMSELTDVVLAKDLNPNETHKITLYKSTESTDSHIGVRTISTDGSFVKGIDIKERKIEFVGDSTSAGFGNLALSFQEKTTENSDCMQAYPALTARALNADFSLFCSSGWGVKKSLYTSPDVNMFDAYKHLDFNYLSKPVFHDFSSFTPDLVVISLGTNDWSYIGETGIDLLEKEARYQAFVDQYTELVKYIHGVYPDAKIIMLYGVMRENERIGEGIESIKVALQDEIPNISSICIFGDRQGASNHPTVQSSKEISQTLVQFIKEQMNW